MNSDGDRASNDAGEIRQYLASMAHVAGVTRSVLSDGRGSGVERAELYTAAGLRAEVLLGRGMDLAGLSLCGMPLHFTSQTGIVHPRYYEESGTRMLRGFFGGFLTTCGLRNAGLPTVECEPAHGLHGRISNTEAEDVCVRRWWEADDYRLEVAGTVRESAFRGENLSLRRTYRTSFNSGRLSITDVVENHGYRTEPLFLFYHINLGYPIFAPGAVLTIPAAESWSYDAAKRCRTALPTPLTRLEPGEPTDDTRGAVTIHTPRPDATGRAELVARSHAPTLARNVELRVGYSVDQLPRLSTFCVQARGCYIFALEPGTSTVEGRDAASKGGAAVELDPGCSYTIDLEVEAQLCDEKTPGRR